MTEDKLTRRLRRIRELGFTVTPEIEQRERDNIAMGEQYRLRDSIVETLQDEFSKIRIVAAMTDSHPVDEAQEIEREIDAYLTEYEAKQAAQDCGCFTCVSNLRNIETNDEANKRYFTDKLIADYRNPAKHTMKEVSAT